MRKTVFGVILSSSLMLSAQAQPTANSNSVFVHENVRFTVLTSGLIRMEWDSTQRFENNASFVAVNRNMPTPKFELKQDNKSIVIKTDKLTLKYTKGKARLSDKNLEITFFYNKEKKVWKPGMINNGNLKGTARTLDGFDGNIYSRDKSEMKIEDGLLSTEGWTLLDDSKNFLFDNSDWNWVEKRSCNSCQDFYFFAYGSDYKAAIYDFTLLAGKVPIPPRFAFGYWWSRYWNYSDTEIRDLVNNFNRYQIPLDVLVIDMDWHTTDGLSFRNGKAQKDEFGERKGWTGYTWNKSLFPDPEKFLKWTNEQNLKVTFNLHPASGILAHEEKYEEFAQAMSFDTAGRKGIPFECADKKFMNTLFDVVLHPMEKQGVDFWWLDWQQWKESKKVPGLSNTWWLNYCFFTDMERRGEVRPLLYHRWGGLGNHRYQIGFSGDALITWNSLAFQPYFTATASNVLYGYWSHDIGGHMFGNWPEEMKKIDPELYTRWMQFGALSPIFRTHSSKDGRLKKEIWNFPIEYSNCLLDAINLRYSLAPYIYTMARKTYETGISICRPMYYDYPEQQEAYEFKNQYFFGDNILVAPVISPSVDNFAKVKVWLPSGNDWYEVYTGSLLKGGQIVERSFLLNEIPMYAKAGSILTMLPEVKNLQENINKLIIKIFPGESSNVNLYEDEGNNDNYKKDAFTTTLIKTEKVGDSILKIQIMPRDGSFEGMFENRLIQVHLTGMNVPASVTVNGNEYSYSPELKAGTWTYTGKDLMGIIALSEMPCSEKVEVTVKFSKNTADLNGFKGKLNRIKKSVAHLKNNWHEGAPLPYDIAATDQTDISITYDPQKVGQLINSFNTNYNQFPALIDSTHVDADTKQVCKSFFK